MAETLANGYSSERTQQELSNEYQHDKVWMVFKNLCILKHWKKVALALEGFSSAARLLHENWRPISYCSAPDNAAQDAAVLIFPDHT